MRCLRWENDIACEDIKCTSPKSPTSPDQLELKVGNTHDFLCSESTDLGFYDDNEDDIGENRICACDCLWR